jgi:hypothetical protein
VTKSWHTGSAGGTTATCVPSGVGWQAVQAKIIAIVDIQRIGFPSIAEL